MQTNSIFEKSAKRPDWYYKQWSCKLQEYGKEKDLEVIIINNRLSPDDHVHEKVSNVFNLLANKSSLYIYL